MLDELKNLEYYGNKESLLFFICDVIGYGKIKSKDAKVVCEHAPGKKHLSVEDLTKYCLALGWIHLSDNRISVSPSIIHLLNDKEKLNDTLILSTVKQLFNEHILDSNMFFYDSVRCCYAFRNELLPLSLSTVRNMLISQGFLMPLRDTQGTRFHISPKYETLIAKYCKSNRKQFSLKILKEQIEQNEIAGEEAELFVLSYEKKRIGKPLCSNIKRISEIDVAAGYDIISFESSQSQELNRYIEVKAVSSSGFYWSSNEYEIARLKGKSYYLYLVELSKINEPDYSPEIIQDPAMNVMKSDRWLVEAQSYFIKHI
ncbi:MAG TPA: DUF3883 domain-containing protein [Clostridia bacterium]|jgi:hypothetical protein|nr:MAG: hypothetical protein BWX97_00124 [Firmicutes bacterium ADurb.Bin146]HPY98725.1 DUF3883 domain-containing protein [Clostridia bacterium]HQC68373.1 DUF3883 domain-containing protein [Clostridia bacterium]